MRIILKIIWAVGLIVVLSSFCAGQNVFIVHSEFPHETLTKKQIADVYLGRCIRWSPVLKAFPIDQGKDSEMGKAFLSKIVEMYGWEYENWWVEVSISGQAMPIQIAGSDEEVVEYVKNTKGAIGYICASTPHEGVKVVAWDGNREF